MRQSKSVHVFGGNFAKGMRQKELVFITQRIMGISGTTRYVATRRIGNGFFWIASCASRHNLCNWLKVRGYFKDAHHA